MKTLEKLILEARAAADRLERAIQRAEPRRINEIENILAITAHHFGFKLAELKNPCREQRLVWARHVAMFCCRTETNATLMEIGRAFGRDHGAVLHGFRRVAAAIEIYPKLNQEVNTLKIKLCENAKN